MLKKYYPGTLVGSVFDIDYSKVYKLGYRGLIFDIDNTLVCHGDNSNSRVDALFGQIHAVGLKTVLLSDNDKERCERFVANIDAPYVCDAEKPNESGFLKALEVLGVSKKNVLYIGDQVFTDICGANRCGIDCVLVKFLRRSGETKLGKKRRVEQFILKIYRLKGAKNKIGDILK